MLSNAPGPLAGRLPSAGGGSVRDGVGLPVQTRHVAETHRPACSIADVKALVDWRLARLGRDRRPKAELLPQTKGNGWRLAEMQDQQKTA